MNNFVYDPYQRHLDAAVASLGMASGASVLEIEAAWEQRRMALGASQRRKNLAQLGLSLAEVEAEISRSGGY